MAIALVQCKTYTEGVNTVPYCRLKCHNNILSITKFICRPHSYLWPHMNANVHNPPKEHLTMHTPHTALP